MDLKVVVLSILVLFLCSEVSSHHVQKREVQEKSPFAQFQEYLQQVSNQTQSWFESLKDLDISVKARETSKQVTEALSTYSKILWDQGVHLFWSSDQ